MTSTSTRVAKKKKNRPRARPSILFGTSSSDSIPIPSFSSSDSSAAESPIGKGASAGVPIGNESKLVKMEAALQVHLAAHRRKGNARQLLTLEGFYSLVRKLFLTETAEKEGQPQGKQLTSAKLSREERLLYETMCVASPSLYGFLQTTLHNSVDEANRDEKVWCIQVKPFSGNRVEELRRLFRLQQINEATSKSILSAIHSHRSASKRTPDKAGDTTGGASEKAVPATNLSMEATILPGMTLDERVRARAEARENRQLAYNKQKESTTTKVDRGVLLQLADGIWLHTRHLVLRQTQLGSSKGSILQRNDKTKSVASRCVMTVNDVVKNFSHVFGSQRRSMDKSESIDNTSRAKSTQRQVGEALQELERLVPGWITVVDPKQNPKKKDRVSKRATVWMEPVDYQATRSRLAGDALDITAPVRKPPIGKRRSPETTKEVDEPATPEFPRAAGTSPTAIHTPPQLVARVSMTPQMAVGTPSPANKKARTTRLSTTQVASDLLAEEKPMTLSGKKRPAAGDPSMRTTPKKRRGLRINPYLILSDADHDGGEIIEPSGASPRGLKMLFNQLRQGKRI